MSRSRAVAVQVVLITGLASLGLGGGAVTVVSGIAMGACLVAPLVRPALRAVPWPLVTLPVLGGIALGMLFDDLTAREALGVLLAYLQAHRRLGWRTPSDDRVTLLLSGLMLVAAAGDASDPLFLPVIVAWAVALPVALLPVELGWGASTALGTGVLFLGAVLFTVIPRPAEGDLGGERVQLTGIQPELEIGGMDVLLDDPEVVFRATLTPAPSEPVYWRGIALDSFDGRRWWSTTAPVPTDLQAPREFASDAVAITLLLEPNDERMVFTTGIVDHLDVEGASLLRDPQGGWFFEGGGRRTVRMMVRPPLGPGAPLAPPEDPETLGRWTHLPPDLDARIVGLASDVAGEGTPAEQVERLADHLRTAYAYTRAPRDAASEAPLSDFLFERRSGHCEYFASGLAVLARARGIPARLVNGFVGGELNPVDGRWTVRRYHAHSWVEVHLPGGGWVTVDATPGPGAPTELAAPTRAWGEAVQAWYAERFLGYDHAEQRALLWASGRAVERALRLPLQAPEKLPWRGLAVLLTLWLIASLVLRLWLHRVAPRLAGERKRRPRGAVARQHARARERVTEQGWRIPDALPPVEAARWLSERLPDDARAVAGALEELAWLYYEVQLGRAPDGDRAGRARELAARLEALPARDDVVIRAS